MKTSVFKYDNHKHLIKDADVLLFKRSGFLNLGWWIKKYTNSQYSHAALAHWCDDGLCALEFRELHGSRIYPLDQYIKEGNDIDVFRCINGIEYPVLVTYPELRVSSIYKEFNDVVRQNIINTAKTLLGKKYSWWTIWSISKNYIPFLRLKQSGTQRDDIDPTKFVCSTLVSYSYRINFLDPVPFLDDEYTTPGDLGRSRLFCKIFEIISEKK
jgi:hypothetical protein